MRENHQFRSLNNPCKSFRCPMKKNRDPRSHTLTQGNPRGERLRNQNATKSMSRRLWIRNHSMNKNWINWVKREYNTLMSTKTFSWLPHSCLLALEDNQPKAKTNGYNRCLKFLNPRNSKHKTSIVSCRPLPSYRKNHWQMDSQEVWNLSLTLISLKISSMSTTKNLKSSSRHSRGANKSLQTKSLLKLDFGHKSKWRWNFSKLKKVREFLKNQTSMLI